MIVPFFKNTPATILICDAGVRLQKRRGFFLEEYRDLVETKKLSISSALQSSGALRTESEAQTVRCAAFKGPCSVV